MVCPVVQLDMPNFFVVNANLNSYVSSTFYIPVAAQVPSVPERTVHGSKPQLQYARICNQEESSKKYESNRLLIHQIPQVDKEHLQYFLESALKMDSQDEFVVEVRGESAIITFLNTQFSKEGR